MDHEIFAAALGLSKPRFVDSLDFDYAGQRLVVRIDFRRDARFEHKPRERRQELLLTCPSVPSDVLLVRRAEDCTPSVRLDADVRVDASDANSRPNSVTSFIQPRVEATAAVTRICRKSTRGGRANPYREQVFDYMHMSSRSSRDGKRADCRFRSTLGAA